MIKYMLPFLVCLNLHSCFVIREVVEFQNYILGETANVFIIRDPRDLFFVCFGNSFNEHDFRMHSQYIVDSYSMIVRLKKQSNLNLVKYEVIIEGLVKDPNVGIWKGIFSADEKKILKDIFGQLLIDLSYEKDLNW